MKEFMVITLLENFFGMKECGCWDSSQVSPATLWNHIIANPNIATDYR
uniref:Uncharacterized protein n=1 Tax=Rhizophora mucronata TaxID=61149 RepID=A0A2P2PDU1_RHIMU